ncbi:MULTISPECIES: HPr family phosphocarrier protein [Serratia]|jgi:hydroxypyruvate isomerase|uniref:Hydroxypyruvate isomerase n=1 Tax=Serratia fonticola TaxID=47917 RepID=A0A0F7HCL7_SERFO|nr:HPr family phosphocarrier protein [Serratia fonticola]AKG70633.1 hydroxypyruvate isomerase [Serratia fonticola]MDK2373496.1 HPr family phosphocarrier protein [Serratia fonticola]NTY89425.1 HPr family phosphocarrier protein [Serratia fonticola]NTZ15066.1 HPr family phosphocarrier protein [Serratia fonticola]CAI0742155.1 Hydroxypyruvate isomerase [Serratia fonticola]
MPKFAANLSMMFTEHSFLDRFDAAAAAGFKAVEFLFPYDYPADLLAEKLQQNGLQQVLFNTAPGDVGAGEWGLAALPGREQDARADIDRALEYAIALKCPNVHVMAGVVPPGEDIARYRETFISNIRYAADAFAPHGIKVLIEALSPPIKPNYLFSSQHQAAELVATIDRPNVFIQFDFFHAQLVDGNISNLIATLAGRYAHIQIASVPDRNEPDDGELNYPWLFAQLDKVGYQGWIGCEYKPRGETTAGLGWVKPYL